MSNELLPCPFCGSSAAAREDTSSDYQQHWSWYVSCCNEKCGGRSLDFKEKQDAINQWNKRLEQITDLERLLWGFRLWLCDYEKNTTERWEHLSIEECDTLSDVQWKNLMKEYEIFRDKKE